MQRKNFKKVGDRLAFNTANGEPIFLILKELKQGYMYFLESAPFGAVQFVHKELVVEEEKETKSSK